jgi:osmotically-inducible protein OsmY
MKTDRQIKQDVERELEWDPAINAAGIGVEVHSRIVTLAGHLGSYTEKLAAEKAAQRVEGVSGVVVELDVRIPGGEKRTDEDIAASVHSVLGWTAGFAENQLKVRVEKGCVTLSGEVEWAYQRHTAENLVSHLRGVVVVVNQITVRSRATPSGVETKIAEALKRHAEHEANNIAVTVNSDTVTLRGHISSFAEKDITRRAAWSAPGVRNVIDEMRVGA